MLVTERITAQDAESRKQMIVLHGLGDGPAGYQWMPAALQLPWLNYLLVNAPDDYYGGYSWFDIYNNPEPGVHRSRKLLTDLLDQQKENGIPSRDTLLFGFSQGGLMTLDVGLRYPDELAGLIGISGFIWQPEELLEQRSTVAQSQRVLVTHGSLDPLLPIEQSRRQIEELQAGGIPIEWHEFTKEHTIAGEPEIDLIRRFVNRCFSETESP